MKFLCLVLGLFCLSFASVEASSRIAPLAEVIDQLTQKVRRQATRDAKEILALGIPLPQSAPQKTIFFCDTLRDALQPPHMPLLPGSVYIQQIRHMHPIFVNPLGGGIDAMTLGLSEGNMTFGDELFHQTHDLHGIYPLVLNSMGLKQFEAFINRYKRDKQPFSGVAGLCVQFNQHNTKRAWDKSMGDYGPLLAKHPHLMSNFYLSNAPQSPFTGEVFTPARIAQKVEEVFNLGFKRVTFSDTSGYLGTIPLLAVSSFFKDLMGELKARNLGPDKALYGFHGHGETAHLTTAIAALHGVKYLDVNSLLIPESGGCPSVLKLLSNGHAKSKGLPNADAIKTVALTHALGFWPGMLLTDLVGHGITSPAYNYWYTYLRPQPIQRKSK